MAIKAKSSVYDRAGERADDALAEQTARHLTEVGQPAAVSPAGQSGRVGATLEPALSVPAEAASYAVGISVLPPNPIHDLNGAADQVKEGSVGGAKAGDLVGITAHSTDPDGGGVSYKILADTSQGGFAIEAKTGVISVKNPNKLDYETAAGHQHKITVQATDWSGLFTTKVFAVKLLDVNEKPLDIVDADGAASTFQENSLAAGATVGITAKAIDPDAGDSVTYSLLVDTSGGGFAIDAKTGVITVKDPAKMDYETRARIMSST